MGHGQKAHLERARLHLFRPCRRDTYGLVRMAIFIHLAARNVGGERAGIDRRAQPFISVRHRAHVILVCVGHEYRFDPVAAFFQPLHIRQDQVHTGRAVHIRKGHTQIDHDQTLFVLRPVPVHIGIHTNFTRPAEGKVDQSFTAHKFSYFPCCSDE